jgi:hypothetical protein
VVVGQLEIDELSLLFIEAEFGFRASLFGLVCAFAAGFKK